MLCPFLSPGPRPLTVSSVLPLSCVAALFLGQVFGAAYPPTAVSPRNVDQLGARDTPSLTIHFSSNWTGTPLKAYITGTDPDTQKIGILGRNTKSNKLQFHPAPDTSVTSTVMRPSGDYDFAIPLDGDKKSIVLDQYLTSAVAYIVAGELTFKVNPGPALVQPDVTNPSVSGSQLRWGIVEFDYSSGGLVTDVSFIDFTSLSLGVNVKVMNGTWFNCTGLEEGAMQSICTDLKAQEKSDHLPWSDLCVRDNSTGKLLRVLGPNKYRSAVDLSWLPDYWSDYSRRVVEKYSSETLFFNTQDGAAANGSRLGCTMNSTALNCPSFYLSPMPPREDDIWSCNSGPFANVGDIPQQDAAARLCAAWSRSTLLLDGGNVQPSVPNTKFYTAETTDHYSRIVHKHLVNGRGYVFPYDDVNAHGEDNSGVINARNPEVMEILVRN